jgi:hypothetical protein
MQQAIGSSIAIIHWTTFIGQNSLLIGSHNPSV